MVDRNGLTPFFGLYKFSDHTGSRVRLSYRKIEFCDANLYNVLFIKNNKHMKHQYTANNKQLEILKMYNGFSLQDDIINEITNDRTLNNISMYNNGGDFVLKFLICWMAASLNGKKIKYPSDAQSIDVNDVIYEFKNKYITDLYLYIMRFQN